MATMGTLLMKISVAYLFLLSISQIGWGQQCSLANIGIGQKPTREHMQGRPEFQVFINNNCGCAQSSLIVKCEGFNSYEPIDNFVFMKVEKDTYVVNDWNPIQFQQTVTFNYTWDYQFCFIPISSNVTCP